MEYERTARLEEQVKAVREDLWEIKKDMKSLLEFKWKIYGVTAFIAFTVTLVAESITRAGK